MQPELFLHELKEFPDLIRIVSDKKSIVPQLVEKDYWIMHCLYGLTQQGFDFELKGGTSLSKGFGIIHRFSEDIDLAAITDGLSDAKRKKLLKAAETSTCSGLEFVPDDERNSKHSNFRKVVYRYPRHDVEGGFGQASPELLLEINAFTHPEPSERKLIQTMIADMLMTEGREDLIEQFNLEAFELNVLSVHRTLIEKLLRIIKDCYGEDPIAKLKIHIRHIYDVCMILRDTKNRDFVSSDEFSRLCQRCIADENKSWADDQTVCLQQPLHAAPLFNRFDQWWPELANTYLTVFADLVYGDLPDADEIKETLGFLHQELVKMK